VCLGGIGKPVVAQPCAAQHGEGEEPPGVPVIADPQPPTPSQPGDRAFGLPAVATQPLRRLDPTAGDADLDPPLGKVAAAAALIVGLVGVNLLGAAAPTADRVRTLGMSSSSAWNTAASGVLAAVTSSDSGSPVPSAARWSLDPGLARSTGFAPARSPPNRAQAEGVHGDARPVQRSGCAELVQQQLLEPLEDPARAHSANRRQQVVTLPQPNSPTGSSAQGVEVRAMNRTAAMQARSETVRGAPPRAREGGGGNSGRRRCHSASGSSRSARVVMAQMIAHHRPNPLLPGQVGHLRPGGLPSKTW
jgi:hypothetical protein